MLPSSCYAAPHPLRAARAACDDISACATLQHPMHATLSSAPALQGVEPTPHAPGLQSTSLTLFTTSFPNNRHHAPPAAATKMLDLSTQLQQPEWAAPRAERVDDCPRAKAGLLAPHNVTLPPQHAARRRDPGKLLLERANGGGCDVLSNGPRTAPTIYSLCRIGAMMAASMLLVLSCCPARAQPVPSSYSARAQLVHSPCPAHGQSVLSLCSARAQLSPGVSNTVDGLSATFEEDEGSEADEFAYMASGRAAATGVAGSISDEALCWNCLGWGHTKNGNPPCPSARLTRKAALMRGHKRDLGFYGTAEMAALAYARAMAHQVRN